MIEVEQLTKRFGDRAAVQDVSFRVEEGEIVGFLGPNGAGKSTTLRMITGYLAPTHGRVQVGGVNALADPLEARRRIGYMPEGVPLYPEMRVTEYLRYRARLKGVGRRDLKRRVEAALGMAAVEDVADRIVGQLSKGYRQRVGLADALVADPPLLILDEPTSGLDPNQIRQVRDLIRGFAGHKTVFLSTHILPEVEATCERVIIIHRGRVVGEGQPEELRSRGGGRVVTLTGRGAEAALRGAVESVEGVERILDLSPLGDDLLRLRAAVEEDPEVTERIFRAVAAAGLVLRELGEGTAKLEDVFASLTLDEEGLGAAPSDAGDDEEEADDDDADEGEEADDDEEEADDDEEEADDDDADEGEEADEGGADEPDEPGEKGGAS